MLFFSPISSTSYHVSFPAKTRIYLIRTCFAGSDKNNAKCFTAQTRDRFACRSFSYQVLIEILGTASQLRLATASLVARYLISP